VKTDFLVFGDGFVISLEGVVIVITDSLVKRISDGNDEFITGNGVDTGQRGAKSEKSSEIRLVKGRKVDSGQEIVAGSLTVFVRVDDSDEPTTLLEGFPNRCGESVGEDLVGKRVVHCENIITEF
jgi:hypothetical protein